MKINQNNVNVIGLDSLKGKIIGKLNKQKLIINISDNVTLDNITLDNITLDNITLLNEDINS